MSGGYEAITNAHDAGSFGGRGPGLECLIFVFCGKHYVSAGLHRDNND